MSARPLAMLAVALCSGSLLCSGFLTAQLKQGDRPPELTFGKVWNEGPQNFADLAGRVVILDFAQTTIDNCKQGVPYLNELHTKYGKRGLLVIGVSDEAEGVLDAYIQGNRCTYAWVKANGMRQKYAIKFWPSTYCLDANGLVHSWADLGPPDETMIEELLQDLPLPPKLPDSKPYEPLRTMWQKAEFAKIAAYIDTALASAKTADDTRAVLAEQKAALDQRQQAQTERIAALGAGPDYTAATMELERMVKSWSGMAPAVAAQTELDRFAADDTIKKEVAAGRVLHKMMTRADTSKLPVLRKLIDDLDRFRKKNEDTYAGKQALAQYTRLCARPKPE